MTQTRWPRGTPVAPSGRGPGGGRFRAGGTDWAARLSRQIHQARFSASVFDTFVDPEFGGPSWRAGQVAERWSHEHFDYRDNETGQSSAVTQVVHHGDGFTVHGGFYDQEGAGVGRWEFALLRYDGQNVATVQNINIKPARRGRGLAKRWVQRLEQAAAAQGAVKVEMWDVSGGFWESQGYTRDERGTAEKTLQPPTDWGTEDVIP